jgi:hypothetical protein
MKLSTTILITFIIVLTIIATKLYAVDFILIDGYWHVTLDATNLESGAGTDIVPIESTTYHVEFEIKGQGGAQPWQLYVKKSAVNWDNNLQLFIKRTSNGNNKNHPIVGGTFFTEITDNNGLFISGEGNNKKIYCQLKLVGSIVVPTNSYSMDVVYTAVE